MKISRILIIILIALVVGAVNNLVNPNKIDWVGYWPNVSGCDSAWFSPSYEKDIDPPVINLGEAFGRYATGNHLFIDARDAEEYQIGHISGSINLPFDYFDDYWDEVQVLMPKDALIITYCSGSECESSLHLARLLVEDYGYENVEIYFGGWQCWYNNRLPIEGEKGYEGMIEEADEYLNE